MRPSLQSMTCNLVVCYNTVVIYNRVVKDDNMAHLLHIDSSIQGERSVSRSLTARAAAAWLAAHPDGTVTYRDLGANPLPHLNSESGLARMVPPISARLRRRRHGS